MAVVPRIATIRIANSVDAANNYRQWQATATIQDTEAGLSVAVSFVHSTVGAPLAAEADTTELIFRNDSGATIRTITIANAPGTSPQTFFFTDTGLTGGAARCGTIEIVIHVEKTTGGPTATYNIETDGSPNTNNVALTSVNQLDRGWIRGTTTLVEDLSNTSLGGAPTAPAQYDESLFVRLTNGAISYVARALAVALSHGSLSGNTNSTTAVTRDLTFSNVVDNRFPAASTSVGVAVTVPNAALTGLPDWTFTSTTDDTLAVDPRLTCEHLLQNNITSFGTPPLVNQNPNGARLASEIGYLSTNIRAARGTLVGNDITQGKNSLTVRTQLQDSAAATSALIQDEVTATKGGEAGWVQSFLQWTSQLPAGEWDKTVSITAPSDITGTDYLLNSTETYVLQARNPDYAVRVNPGTSNPANHLVAGEDLDIQAWLLDTFNKKTVAADEDGGTPLVTVHVWRVNSDNVLQFLDAAFDWIDAHNGAGVPVDGYAHQMTQLANQNVYHIVFTTDSTWTNDIVVGVRFLNAGFPYDGFSQREVVESNNPHDRYLSVG